MVAGIAHYGNCVGVPTVGGEVAFDPSYAGNPLVNAMALGLMETDEIVKSGAAGVGNPVVYVGSTTGRDGMGGASFASAELSADSLDDRPAVQVGDPFLREGLIEACLEAFASEMWWLLRTWEQLVSPAVVPKWLPRVGLVWNWILIGCRPVRAA